MSVRVGPAGSGDIDEIAALEAAAFPLDPWSPNLLREAVGGLVPTMALLAARSPDDGVFAGYAVVSVVDVDAELQRIAVPPALRRTGVAAALLAATRALAAERGATRLLLEVREDNVIARTFYDRHGFAELGRRPRYYRDGTTALVLSAPVTMDP
ncbi:ribosomal protein S18-alanine N-acetyltransferase [Pimelobacter simplex]|uniref:[Ribosomal protein bS18]-alanine N-acetyltransferase n=1 Tax=Nocardioides simplex TaxID=2045 RepID=A0A7J5DWA4_NOCSI|nr:ribosomal protein S18-alanine N-acetyltransferase [Pimelobacter simplex]KAB2809581.1 ribosomal-protein-alanine N-acetyltransferase [Pimelobacter simplex]